MRFTKEQKKEQVAGVRTKIVGAAKAGKRRQTILKGPPGRDRMERKTFENGEKR